MNSDEKELLRLSILRVLDTNATRYGLSADALRLFVKAKFGIDATKDEMLDEITYLEMRRPPMVEEAMKNISRENRVWRIADEGRAELDRRA